MHCTRRRTRYYNSANDTHLTREREREGEGSKTVISRRMTLRENPASIGATRKEKKKTKMSPRKIRRRWFHFDARALEKKNVQY